MKISFVFLAFLLILTIGIFAYGLLDGRLMPGSDHPDNNSSINTSNNTSIIVSATAIPSPCPTPPTTTPEPSSYLLYDNFNGDGDIWTKRANTWSSSYAYTVFEPDNVWYDDGKAVLRSYVDDHTGGEIKSDGEYSYGKYRASIKLDQTQGSYLTFYSYQWPTGNNREGHYEIDIELQKIEDRYTALFSTWVKGIKSRYMYYLPFDPQDGYHTYGYDWYPDRVEFYIDNMDTPVWTSRSNIPDHPMYVYFQNWIPRSVPEQHGDGISTEYVDWVSVAPL